MPKAITPSWPKTGLAPAQSTKYDGRTAPACLLPPRVRRDPTIDTDLADKSAKDKYSRPVHTKLERVLYGFALKGIAGLNSDDRSRIRLFDRVTVNDVRYYVQNPSDTPAAERARLLENYAIILNFHKAREVLPARRGDEAKVE